MTEPSGKPAASVGGNLFADVPPRLTQEEITTLLASPVLRIERIVSHGPASTPGFWYDQPQAERGSLSPRLPRRMPMTPSPATSAPQSVARVASCRSGASVTIFALAKIGHGAQVCTAGCEPA